MSKLRCHCGNIIVDQSDNLSYKALYLLDEGYDKVIDRFMNFGRDLFEAYKRKSTNSFIEKEFGEKYPKEKEGIKEFLDEAFSRYIYGFQHTMYECEVCGRLWLQFDRNRNAYVSYLPEEEMRNILSDKYRTVKDE